MRRSLCFSAFIGAAFAIMGMAHPATADEAPKPIIFAAASLTEVLPAILGPDSAVYVFGPSATLARQIDSGAPADIYISANPEWTKWLGEKEHLKSTAVVAGNRLVLVVPANDPAAERELTDGAAFMQMIGERRLAVADPRTAPAGKYARTYLHKIGISDQIAPHLAMGESVRAALRLVERGGLPGLVYESDTAGNLAVRIIARIPEGLSGEIRYAGGLVSDNAQAQQLFTRITAPDADAAWQRFGFVPVSQLSQNGTQ